MTIEGNVKMTDSFLEMSLGRPKHCLNLLTYLTITEFWNLKAVASNTYTVTEFWRT